MGKKRNTSEQKEMDELLNQAAQLSESIGNQPTKQDYQVLANVLSEYMNSFVLIGYNAGDEGIQISYTRNQKDADALKESVTRYCEQINTQTSEE